MGTLASTCNDRPYEKIVSLFKAIRHDNFKRAKNLMLSGIDINCINYSGATPLIETCRCRHLPQTQIQREEFVKFLIDMGCDIMRIDIHGRTALLYAEINGHDTIVELLDRYENRKRKTGIILILYLYNWYTFFSLASVPISGT